MEANGGAEKLPHEMRSHRGAACHSHAPPVSSAPPHVTITEVLAAQYVPVSLLLLQIQADALAEEDLFAPSVVEKR